jgi:hypothetical protein
MSDSVGDLSFLSYYIIRLTIEISIRIYSIDS